MLLRCLFLSLAFMACDPPRPSTPTIAVSGLEPRTLRARVGERVTVTARSTDGAGAPVEPFQFMWHLVSADQGTVSDTSAPAERTRTVTVQRLGRFTLGGWARACDTCESVEFGPVEVVVLDADAIEVVPILRAPRLVVGETRLLGAFAFAQVAGRRERSGDAVRLESSDPGVARIESSGAVVGVAPGSVTLTWRAGSGVATDTLTVVAGAIGAPGGAPVDVLAPGQDRGRIANPKTDHQLAVDARGWPVVIAEPGGEAALLSWTGSGFGAEPLGAPGSPVEHPQVAVGFDDRIWVTFVQEFPPRIVVQDRPVAGGAWRVRTLPRRRVVDETEPPEFEDDHQFALGNRQRFSMLPRVGGGVWVAHFLWREQLGEPCLRTLRLVEVTESAVTPTDVERLTEPPVALDCDMFAALNEPRDLYVAPDPGHDTPRVVAHLVSGANNIRWSPAWGFVACDGAWRREKTVPTPEAGDPAAPDRIEPLVMTLAQPITDPATWIWNSEQRTFQDELTYFVHGAEPLTRWRGMFDTQIGGALTWDLYAMRANGSTYTGDLTIGPQIRVTPRGLAVLDDVTPLVAPPTRPDQDHWSGPHALWFVRGTAAERGALHWLYAHQSGNDWTVSYARLPAPKPAEPTDPDTTGTRLSDDPRSPIARVPMLVLRDGTRLVAARAEPPASAWMSNVLGGGQLFRAGPGEVTFARVDDREWTGHFVETATGVRGLRAAGRKPTEAVFSTDGGRTWSSRAAFPSSGVGDLVAVRHEGAATFALTKLNNFVQLWCSPNVEGGTAFLDRTVGMDGLLDGNESSGLIPAANGATLVTWAGTSWRMRTFDASCSLVEDRRDTVQTNVDWATAVRAADGTFWAMSGSSVARTSDGFRTITTLPSSTTDLYRPQLVRFADGRLVVGATRKSGPDRYRAFIITSTDGGQTWSAPRDLRPEGGAGQFLASLTAGPDGSTFAMVGDDTGFRAWRTVDVGPYTGAIEGYGLPHLDGIVVRVPPQ